MENARPQRLCTLRAGERFCAHNAYYIKTNMMNFDRGGIYCCNLYSGVMDIFPIEEYVIKVENDKEHRKL